MHDRRNIEESAGQIRKLWEKHGIQSPLRLLGFCLSLLPIPIIQQAGQTLDRHYSDKEFQTELDAIWEAIRSVNPNTERINSLEAGIAEIAITLQQNQNLLERCQSLSEKLASKDSRFKVCTSDQSYQQITNSIVTAGRTFIASTDGSTNVIENSQFNSHFTHLHASGGSRNFFDKVSFNSTDGGVSMHGISTQGDLGIAGSKVGFMPGSWITFGAKPNVVKGICPLCEKELSMDERDLQGLTDIQCPHCLRSMPFTVT